MLVENFQLLMALRNKLRSFISLWNESHPIREKTIPHLQAMMDALDKLLVKGKVIKVGEKVNIEVKHLNLSHKLEVLERTRNDIAHLGILVHNIVTNISRTIVVAFNFKGSTEKV